MQQAAYKPQDSEIQQLQQLLAMPGYQILQKIQMGEIDQFQVDLMNLDPDDAEFDKKARTRHNLALAAGMFYQRVTNKIAGHINRLNEKHNQPQVLPDVTSDLLDY
jgi:hypothetical protein